MLPKGASKGISSFLLKERCTHAQKEHDMALILIMKQTDAQCGTVIANGGREGEKMVQKYDCCRRTLV